MMLHEIKYNAEIIKNQIVVDEDQQKIDLKNIYFKKSNDINYKKLDNDTIQKLDDNYQLEIDRYSYLVDKVFSDTPLDNSEMYELDYLTIKIGDYVTPRNVIKIILYSEITINLLYMVDSAKTLLSTLKRPFKRYTEYLYSIVNNTYSMLCIKYRSSSDINFFNSISNSNNVKKILLNDALFLDSSPPKKV